MIPVSVTIKKLKEKFKEIALATIGIRGFAFDDLSKINENRDKEYPVLLFNPPKKVFDPNAKVEDQGYHFYDITFFVFKPGSQADEFTYDEIWEELEPMGTKVIKEINRSDSGSYFVVGNVAIDYGHHQHNDGLYGVRYKFRLRTWYGCD